METLQQEESPIEEQPIEGQIPAQETVNWKRFALDILETLLLAVILFLGINAISARVRVDGFSMRPTLEDGEFVLVSKLNYRFGKIDRGDIIVFHYPVNPKQELIKRVIGLPGDYINVQGGVVSVNGQALDEPYIAAMPLYTGDWVVPEGQLFVLGDNRNDSSDSHSWGYLPFGDVVGKAVVIYWPPPQWDVIRHKQLLVTQ
ncbi:MAG: signal peptidase I [Anaerolineales bacterium]|nr:signal peptidase I [Anaerolineales bacterium]